VTQKLRTPQHVEAVDMLTWLGSCGEPKDWLHERSMRVAPERRTAEAAWKDCERGDWMLWLVTERPVCHNIGSRTLRLLACDVAETVMPLFASHSPDDTRPQAAIKTARRFACGRATAEELHEARLAADLAALDVSPTVGVKGSPVAIEQFSISQAAEAGAFAAHANAVTAALEAGDAADAADCTNKARRARADIVRRHVPWAIVRDALRPVAEAVRRANRDSQTIFNWRR
jgi:hypothetical protein